MTKKDVTYSNRQVRGSENLFGPDDLDALLVGGINQPGDQTGDTALLVNNVLYAAQNQVGGKSNDSDAEDETWEEDEFDPDTDVVNPNKPEVLGAVTSVSFSHVGKFTPNGTYLADVTATIEDVLGATDYEIQFVKKS